MREREPKAITDIEILVGDVCGELMDVIERCADEGYLTQEQGMLLLSLANELADQFDEDLEATRRAKAVLESRLRGQK